MDPDPVVPTRKERDDLYGLSESQMSKFLGGWWSFMITDPLTGSTYHQAPSKRLTSEGPFFYGNFTRWRSCQERRSCERLNVDILFVFAFYYASPYQSS